MNTPIKYLNEWLPKTVKKICDSNDRMEKVLGKEMYDYITEKATEKLENQRKNMPLKGDS